MFPKNSSGKNLTAPQAASPAAAFRKHPPTVISADVNLLGNLISEGMLDIDGRVEGNIRAKTVTIRKNGAILGDITAEQVQVHGHVKGVIRATDVGLFATAHVEGVIMHASLLVEDGAYMDGQLKRTEKALETSVVDASEMDILQNLKLIS